MKPGEKLTSKARTLKELSSAYGVGDKVMRNWLECKSLSGVLGDKIGYYFNVAQVRAIVNHLGDPD